MLASLGAEKAWVVHGHDGLDELSISDITHVAVLDRGRIEVMTVSPEDAGLPRWPLAEVKGGEAQENAAALTACSTASAVPIATSCFLTRPPP